MHGSRGDDQARWRAEALAQLPADEVHLLGVSIGGWTAMNLAVREPEGIASVISLDPVFTFASLSPEAIVRSIPASMPWFPKSWRDSFNSWGCGWGASRGRTVADMIDAGMQGLPAGVARAVAVSDTERNGRLSAGRWPWIEVSLGLDFELMFD